MATAIVWRHVVAAIGLRLAGDSLEGSATIQQSQCEKDSGTTSQNGWHDSASSSRPDTPASERSFPNLTRHGKNSLLKRYLTPAIYDELSKRQTSKGVKLEDLIRSGVSLPAHPLGVFAGDAESYTVFADLLDPIIAHHHKVPVAHQRSPLQRFQTNLDPQALLSIELDSRYVLFTRMRLARSIEGIRFTPCMDRAERRKVESLIKRSYRDFQSIHELSNAQHADLMRRRLLFDNPDPLLISAGLGGDWPDARGVWYNKGPLPSLWIWCNAYDHVWIVARGDQIQTVFSELSRAVKELERRIQSQGYRFAYHKRLGFLNASPADIGTALRASVVIKLVRLGRRTGFKALLGRLNLEAEAKADTMGRYTGVFDIGNASTLGKTEVQLINIMIQGATVLIDLERRLEQGEDINLDDVENAALSFPKNAYATTIGSRNRRDA